MAQYKSLNLIYEETKTQIERQFSVLSALDAKANFTAGFAGIIIGIMATRAGTSVINYIKVASMSSLLCSLIFAIISLWIVGWRSDPFPPAMKKYLTEDETVSRRQFLENLISSFEENRKRINRKVRWIRLSMAFLFIGLILTFIIYICPYFYIMKANF